MNNRKEKITKLLIDYFESDSKRINHALEVLKHAEEIMVNARDFDYEVVVASALLHDIGIKESERILGYNTGKTQEEYAPPYRKKAA